MTNASLPGQRAIPLRPPARQVAGATRLFTAGPSTDLRNYGYLWAPPDTHVEYETVQGKAAKRTVQPSRGTWSPPVDAVKLLDRRDVRLDQGVSSACERFSVGNASVPQGLTPTNAQCLAGYHRAQELDEWPGAEPRYYGTSGNGACKAAREEGIVKSWWYVPEDRPEYIVAAILFGYAVQWSGVWTEGMAWPNDAAVMSSAGAPIGGHATVFDGWIGPWGLLRVVNSWSEEWGKDGVAYLSWDDYLRNHWERWPEAIIINYARP